MGDNKTKQKAVKPAKTKGQGAVYLRKEVTTAIVYTILGAVLTIVPTVAIFVKKLKVLPKVILNILNASGMNICYAFLIATGVVLLLLAVFGFIAIALEKDRYAAV